VLLVSQFGIRTCNPKSSICMIMTPPFEIATVYNKSTKKYFQAPVKALRCPMQKTLALFNAYVLGEAPMGKVGTGQLDGFNVVKYRTSKAFEVKAKLLRKTDNVPSSNPSVIDSQSTDDFHLPPSAGEGLCKYYGVPWVSGIPLSVEAKDTDGDPSVILKSSKGQKIKVTASDFLLPPGFTREKSLEEVHQSSQTEDAMQLFGR